MKTKRLYEFGPFRLDPEGPLLLREGKPVYLKPKVLETLLVLVENSGRVLDKETLMQRLWQDTFVEEANLTVNISQLRKALGQTDGGEQFIETMPRRGYRFAAEVREVWAEEAALVVKEYTSSRITIEEKEASDEQAAEAGMEPTPAAARFGSARWTGQHKKLAIGAASLVVIAVVVALAFDLLGIRATDGMRDSRATPQGTFGQIKLKRVTNLGKVYVASISPDGKYVAYVLKDGRRQGLWLHHIATSQNVEVVPATETEYMSVRFTPDSNYIDYSLTTEEPLYRVAVLGGASKRIIDSVMGDVAYSPDGERLVFLRSDPENIETSLVVANLDGTGQRVIATRKRPDYFFPAPSAMAWSPDGKAVAATAGHFDRGEAYYRLFRVNVEDGAESPIGEKRWLWLMGVSWAKDSGDIFVAASDVSYGSCQIWRVSYPGGELERVTNDLNGYLSLSMPADSGSLVTVQQTQTSTIWVAPNGDAGQATQISSSTIDGIVGLCATADGRVVYTSKAGGNWDLWIMNSDGTGKRQLTGDSNINQLPAVSPDGRYIVFSSNRSGGWGIWRMDSDGSNPIKLTDTLQWVIASCSPDGKWVVYQHSGQIWKVAIEGGEPVQLTRGISVSGSTAVSPDGEWIACAYTDKSGSAPRRLGIIPFEGGEPIKRFDLPPDITFDCMLRWAADGSAVCYTRYITSSKIWLQPIDGSPARELTDFKTDGIWDFSWSSDGKQLFCARGGRYGDVVLISNLR